MELLLLKMKGKVINTYNNTGFTPLLIAVKNNFIEGTLLLVQSPDINLNIPDKIDNYTAVSFASQQGYLEILKILIDAKANINEESAYEESPLLLALQNEKLDCSIALLEAGASVDCVDEQGNSLLFFAARLGYQQVVDLLVQGNRQRAKQSDTAAVDRDYVNEQNNNWERPLILAAKNNYLSIVKTLMGNVTMNIS
jgi:ankyrin repeat protein